MSDKSGHRFCRQTRGKTKGQSLSGDSVIAGQTLSICNSAEFASLPPSQIVPKLADQGHYLASDSSFYRILRAQGQQHHRGRANPPVRRKPPTSCKASAPCEVWTWE